MRQAARSGVKAVEPTPDLRGACAESLVSSRPGSVGAPPGDTTIPRQELANVGRAVLRRTDARPGMGRYRSPAARELTPEIGPTARRATGCTRFRAPASSGAPSPSLYFRGRPKQARPGRRSKRAAERWLSDN